MIMPKEKVAHLITDLHDRFGDDLVSPQQQSLLEQVKTHAHEMDEAEPADPDFLQVVETFVTEVESEHPNAASILKQVLDTLKNIGV
jgi:Mg-chelatase subunit ChlI